MLLEGYWPWVCLGIWLLVLSIYALWRYYNSKFAKYVLLRTMDEYSRSILKLQKNFDAALDQVIAAAKECERVLDEKIREGQERKKTDGTS